MKDKINRLAKGIMEEERPVLLIRPEQFSGILDPGTETGFALEIESLSGRSMRGFCFCDDPRVRFAAGSFMGRIVHQGFTVSASNLPDGSEISGTVSLLTNAGEFSVPYCFTVKARARGIYGKEDPFPDAKKFGCVTESTGSSEFPGKELPTESGKNAGSLFEGPAGAGTDAGRAGEAKLLSLRLPEDEELLLEVCSMLIRENVTSGLAFVFLNHAVARGLQITHLYESFLAAWPEERTEPMPREILLYYSYGTVLSPLEADRLYRNVMTGEPEGSELYRQYEPRIRDFAVKSLLDGRMNGSLKYIYDRMFYPDMIDTRMAQVLPDILRSCRIRTDDPAAVTVHVQYPQLNKVVSSRLKDGQAFVPVYFSDAVITFHDADGSRVSGGAFRCEKMMDRPDLLRRCFEIDAEHPMLLFSAVREILGRGVRSEEEKKILLMALKELDLKEGFRSELIRSLCRAGGDTSWIDQLEPQDLNRETGSFAFRAFLENGRLKDAYLYVRNAGLEGQDIAALSRLATELLSQEKKPVISGTETDRFFTCMCKKIFDAGQASMQIMDFLTEEYEGATEEMSAILREADRNGLPLHELPERTLSAMLFAETRTHLDETFVIYLKKDVQKETVLKAFFTFRMTDYFERDDTDVAGEVFEALTSYLGLVRYPEDQPEICLIGLTKHYSLQESLSTKELELCRRLTGLLISRDLIFPYTKVLRKKIQIPAAICERFYVQYNGTKTSVPRMIARISPDETGYHPVNLRRVFHNVYVASTVLFLGDGMSYLVYDDAIGPDPVQQGEISVKKMHGREEDRFLLLNRMTRSLAEGDSETLLPDMQAYAVGTEVNQGLFQVN